MTKVKICGITNLEDALVAVEAGADLLGFIFYEPSPRYVAPETVRDIVSGIREWVLSEKKRRAKSGERRTIETFHAPRFTRHASPQVVGVFVNAPLQTIVDILNDCQLDAAQLHGDESPEFVNHFQGRAYKALRPQTLGEAASLLQKYQPTITPTNHLPHFLIDAYHPTLYGGTGHVTDWTIATSLARRYSVMLAGSLTPANVAEAVLAVEPWGVDVSSGVERAKGKKDHEKVREFIRTAKSVKREA